STLFPILPCKSKRQETEVCLRLFIHWHSRTHSDIVSLSRTAVRPDQLYSDDMNIVWISTGLLLRNPAPTPPP
ncbi:hypothetical protein ATANTOWER_016252, partial [Ataeniobius toweri]|nr:hypothetical protein [Ataeniobius toweri]